MPAFFHQGCSADRLAGIGDAWWAEHVRVGNAGDETAQVRTPPSSRKRSSATAPMMMRPLMMYCHTSGTPVRISPFDSTAMISAPTSVPQIEPMPPTNEVPPRMTAAMASSS